jgi:hypothetical protein
MGAVLLCRDHCSGTVRQLDKLEKAIEWERRRLEEADAKTRLRQQAAAATARRVGVSG